ncbi:hypothetical protein TrLO_g6719 [Triparma laevis f. longispina]|uniref:CBS domain-containing protein n=1 Tax=Triparma laevis f. longispina TaxID=1714387 RepID=A0A9W7FNU4_9STRA|nr:hypothetical protein TrLO_g6719 [Triparma laevis f. longispina]
MIGRISSSAIRVARGNVTPKAFAVRNYQSIDKEYAGSEGKALMMTAESALAKSCFSTIDWKISEDAKVMDMLKSMVANKIGAMAVTDSEGKVVGIVSERDYLSKVAFLGKTSDKTSVKEIATYGFSNLVTVTPENPIERCMEKMLGRDVRHLLVRKDKESHEVIGMISVKDIVKCTHEKTKAQMNRLEDIITYKNIADSAV